MNMLVNHSLSATPNGMLTGPAAAPGRIWYCRDT